MSSSKPINSYLVTHQNKINPRQKKVSAWLNSQSSSQFRNTNNWRTISMTVSLPSLMIWGSNVYPRHTCVHANTFSVHGLCPQAIHWQKKTYRQRQWCRCWWWWWKWEKNYVQKMLVWGKGSSSIKCARVWARSSIFRRYINPFILSWISDKRVNILSQQPKCLSFWVK